LFQHFPIIFDFAFGKLKRFQVCGFARLLALFFPFSDTRSEIRQDS